MERSNRHMPLLATLFAPLAGLFYLYASNAQYLNLAQTLLLGAVFVGISLLGYFIFRKIFGSPTSGMLTVLLLWVAFYGFSPLYPKLSDYVGSYYLLLAAYFGGALVLSVAVGFFTRRLKTSIIGAIAFVMCAMLFALNISPAVRAAIALYQTDADTQYKKEYAIDETLPSPNIYWVHADGMLGFDAFETYFGDDQQAFKDALTARGFGYSEDAQLEVGHRTVVAVAALMSPYFYDTNLKDRFASHEQAMDSAWDRGFLRNELQNARTYNETRLAFEKKGYTSQTMADFKIYFPPVSDRFYVTLDPSGAYLLDMGENAEDKYLSYVQAGELSEMLTRKNITPTLLKVMTKLIRYNLSDIKREPLTHVMERADVLEVLQGSTDAKRFGATVEALHDALYVPAPTFNMVFYDSAHAPFVADETGHLTGKDETDLFNYPPQHRFSVDVLMDMVDMIIAKDPDAVIVIQSDHGLHLQSAEQITQALGEEAVIPLWNQVISAIRVPEKWQNGEETQALSNPLNMSRYLVNRFAGENYEYLDAN